jgi:hypothetical protein
MADAWSISEASSGLDSLSFREFTKTALTRDAFTDPSRRAQNNRDVALPL